MRTNRDNKIAILLFSILSFGISTAHAYDFSFEYQGKTLYYDSIVGEMPLQAKVTFFNNDHEGDNNYVSGNVVIPSSVTFNGNTYSITMIGIDAFTNCTDLTSITIPSSVTSIGSNAFSLCTNLTSIDFGTSVETIGSYAFAVCSSLTNITLPSSLNSIGSNAFSGCSGLISINLPNSLTSIDYYAFASCNNLTSIEVPTTIDALSDGVFYNCSSLANVILPSTLSSIGRSTFENCSSLTNINIPTTISFIGNGAFAGCVNLNTSIVLENVSSLGERVFEDCASLTTISLGENLKQIDGTALNGCTGIDTIYCYRQNPPLIMHSNDAFKGVSRSSVLSIPYNRSKVYQNAMVWKEFSNIIERDSLSGIEDIVSNASSILIYPNPTHNEISLSLNSIDIPNATISIYDLSGKILLTTSPTPTSTSTTIDLSSLPKGIYTITINNNQTKQSQKIIKR